MNRPPKNVTSLHNLRLVKPKTAAARRQSATKCRFVCLSMTERRFKVMFPRPPGNQSAWGRACGDRLIVHQSQCALDGIQEKRQDFWDTLYLGDFVYCGQFDPRSNFDLDLLRSQSIYYDASRRQKHDGLIAFSIFLSSKAIREKHFIPFDSQ